MHTTPSKTTTVSGIAFPGIANTVNASPQKLLSLCTAQSAADSSPAFRLWLKSMEIFCGESAYCRSSAAQALATANNARVLCVTIVDTNTNRAVDSSRHRDKIGREVSYT